MQSSSEASGHQEQSGFGQTEPSAEVPVPSIAGSAAATAQAGQDLAEA